MLKRFLMAIAIALPMLASAQTLKIGVVDIAAIVSAHPDTEAAQKQLADAGQKFDAEYQKLGQEGQKLYEEYTESVKNNELPAIQERKATAVQDMQNKLQQFEANAQRDLSKMQQDLMTPILQKVQDAITSVAKEGNFSLIQNRDQQIVFYVAAPVEDITDRVKAKLNMK